MFSENCVILVLAVYVTIRITLTQSSKLRSRSFEVNDFCYNWKLIYDFL